MNQFYSAYLNFIQTRQEEGLERKLKTVTPHGADKITHNNREYINFSSNDYLGLRSHPALGIAANKAIELYGNGSGASRLVTGNYDLYERLESKIARWKGKESCLIMNSGFQCNTSVLASLFDKQVLGDIPLVFSDKLIHASMHQGCNLAGIKQIRFNHNDTDHLAQLLDKYKDSDQPKFILTESVFSMDGDIAPLEDLYTLRDTHNACLIVDDAHGTGVFGKNGCGLGNKADIIIGTCGKALGSFGSYVACDTIIKDYLTQHCAGLIYATALPPAVLGMIEASIDLMPSLDEERKKVLSLAIFFRNKLKSMNLDYGASETQIVPLIIGGTEETLALSNTLKEAGFWASAIRPPTVPQNKSRIRFAFSAQHKQEDVETLLDAIANHYHKVAA